MGCCCCCIRARKQDTDPGPDPFAGRAGASQPDTNLNPDTEIKIEEIGSPPPYEAKAHNKPEKHAQPSVLSASTTLYGSRGASGRASRSEEQGIRVGVKSTDQTLYGAAAGGHLEEVKRLLEAGVNPSDRTVCDWCPLHWAAHNDLVHGHEIVKLLVRYGADVNQVSDTGLTPLDLARRAERGENVRFLEGVGGMSGLEVRGHSMGLLE